jgi:Xaa-Pro aminopeptidase
VGPIAIEDPMPILSRLRQVKSSAELVLMRRAADMAAKAHNYAREITAPGRYEYEIAAEIEYLFNKSGGGIAYPSIVASGKNSCILHYIANNQQMQDGDLLLIDAGCSYQYYNSDITRTFPVNGKFTPPQKALYELVLEAQKQAIAQVKPGNFYHQIHEAAVQVITEGLVELGLLRGNVEELVKAEKYKPFYMHNTGHWLGLDVHDTGIYKQGEEGEPLQPGEVLTVEPGIYIGADLQPAIGQPVILEQWLGIGIRIEDDFLVTEKGNEVLTTGVPKSVAEMER